MRYRILLLIDSACSTICDIIAKNRPDRNLGYIAENLALFERCYGEDYKEEVSRSRADR